MKAVLRKIRRRLASDRGSVGVVVAIFIFFSLGLLTMTWNTAQLSKAKMRLQNAADSAALAHAIWQARGMNAVQNINDEMYETLSLAHKLRTIGRTSETVAQTCDGLSVIPVIGGFFKVLAKVSHTIGVLFGGSGGWLSARITKLFLVNFEGVYVYGSSLFGYWNAQQIAAQNEADPLAKWDSSKSTETSGDDWHFGIFTLGVSYPFKDAFMLPLKKSDDADTRKAPWHGDQAECFNSAPSPWNKIYKFCGSAEGWDVKPFVSKRESKSKAAELPGPTVWVAFKLGKNIQTLPIDGFYNARDSGKWTHNLPMFAIAAAQCVTGDVVPHSKKREKDGNDTNQRPAGFGAGATAKLVPVSDMFYKMNSTAGGVVDALIYH